MAQLSMPPFKGIKRARRHVGTASTVLNLRQHRSCANDYEQLLGGRKVVADFDKRQMLIKNQVKALADEINADAIVPQSLLMKS